MRDSFKRIVTGISFFALTLIVAVSGYVIAGWTLLDSIYMVVITIFGVGYGEVRPMQTVGLRIFTILVIIAGALSVAYTVAGFVQLVTEGEIQKALSAKRMSQEIQDLHDHVIICGFGRIGQMLARKLKAEHCIFVILDNDTDRINRALELGYLVYQGNATDETNLQMVSIERARALATVLPDDATNVFITLTARELNPNLMILARGEMPSTEKKLRLAGADHVVLPATISAFRMAHLISHPAAVDFLSQDNGRANLNELLAEIDIQVNELAITPDSGLLGGTVGDIEVRGKGTFIIVALRRADGETLIHPGRSTPLMRGDVIIIMGHQEDMPKFMKQHALKREMRYRGARIR